MIRIVSIVCILLPTAAATVLAQSAPVLSNLESANLTYTEGDPATSLTSTIQLNSEAAITHVTIQIAENYVADQDRLLFSDTEDIRGLYDEATGSLRLLSYPLGTARSAVSFQNALRTVSYRNTNTTSVEAGLRIISFQAFDEQNQGSNTLSRALSVLARNDAPRLALPDDAPLSYLPAGIGQNVNMFEGLVISDVDDNVIESAEVTISEGFRNSEDQLSLMDIGSDNINVSIRPNRRTITLNGSDTPEAYQTALRAIQFSNSTQLIPTEGNRIITATVNDGDAQSVAISRFIVVGRSNSPPDINPVAKVATVGADLPFTRAEFADQYSDPEGNTSFTGIFIRSKPQYGTLFFQGEEVTNSSINAGLLVATNEFSELIYRPANNFIGTDQFLWNASDGANFAANNAAVTITVTPPELAVTLGSPEPATAEEDREVILPPVGLTATQNVPLTVTLSVSNGTLTLPPELIPLLSFTSGDGTADPSMVFTGSALAVVYVLSGIRYLPSENYNGPDAVSVSVSATSTVNDQSTVAITVVPRADPFQLANLETDALVYTENDPPVALTNQITVEDLDSESTLRIASATITIVEGYVPGEDSLQFNSLLDIEGSQQDSVLMLSGVGDISDYQTALRTITYQNTSDEPAANKTIAFTLLDEADSASNTVTRSITIQPVEDPPQLTGLEDFPIYHVVENNSAISNTLSIDDPDTRTINQVVVSVAQGYDRSLDSLYLEGFSAITKTWDDDQGVLTLSGANTLETYMLALRAVRYRNNHAAPDEQPRTLNIQAFNTTASEVVSRSIVLITNDPPVVSDFEVNTATNVPYVFTLPDFAESYTDPDNAPIAGGPIQIRITALPQNGVLVYQEDTLPPNVLETAPGGYIIPSSAVEAGGLSYLPSSDFTGTDALRWNAFDGAEIAETDAGIRINVLDGIAISIEDSVAVCRGATDTLAVSVSSGQAGVSYAWACAGNCGFVEPTDQPTVVITPMQTTDYVVTVTTSNGALSTQDTVTVVVDDCAGITLDIPSGFTPDADQANDVWVIKNAEAFTSLTVEVFDRYGHSVYRSEDYQNDWDGTYEGTLLPVGTYYYLVTAPEGQTYKGALSILR